ncbi:MAG: hypothetical protein LUG13_01435 [Oscillospiraceae bacterium]|nr:hypothetical protein [Oscillospiraceae bacterium]
MAEMDEKLNAILGNPEAMEQIMAIAKSVSNDGAPSPAPQADDTQAPEEPHASDAGEDGEAAPSAPGGSFDFSALLELLGQGDSPLSLLRDLDPAILQKAAGLFSAYGAGDDKRVSLLSALKPFVKEARQPKVDRAIQIAKLSRVIRIAFQFLKKEGDEPDV